MTVTETDLRERTISTAALTAVAGGTTDLDLRPFQLVTLRFAR
ncbi:hypothetical protein [Microbacterium aurantiacum]|nr:hypothetical protein [Microbacterium aurantiacum]